MSHEFNPALSYDQGRFWKRIILTEWTPSVNPTVEALYVAKIVAMRSDGVGFVVEVGLKKAAIDVQLPAQVLNIARFHLQQALEYLEGYRECGCQQNKPCTRHGGSSVH